MYLSERWIDCVVPACKASLSGSGPAYRSGRSPDWLKMKNPACAAVKREEEEDWGKDKWR
jgi:hypothetical protein